MGGNSTLCDRLYRRRYTGDGKAKGWQGVLGRIVMRVSYPA